MGTKKRSLSDGSTPSTRRNTRKSLRAGLTVQWAELPDDVRSAYELIRACGREKGYPIKPWSFLGPCILELLRNRQAVFLAVRKEDALVGACLAMKGGRRLSSVLGGMKRLVPDACVGYFAQFQLMLRAQAEGLVGYDLTGRADEGVNRFKEGFRPLQLNLARPCYLPLGRACFSALKALLNFAKSNHSALSRIGQIGCAARAAVTAWVR